MKLNSVILCVLILFMSCKGQKSTNTIKLAHSLGTSHPVHEAMMYMAKKVEENSNGKLKLEVYPNSQLGSEQQCLELLQIGSLGMTKVSSAVMENFSPDLKVYGYPYLFKDYVHRYKVYDSQIGQELLLGGEKFWLRGLTYFDAGSRSFYTKEKMIKSPDDLKGLKIRVMQSPTSIDMVKSFGGSPTPISWGELYTSLQQGVVDGAENNLPSFYTSKHYEVCKYYSVNEHSAMPDILVMGTIIWKGLSDQEKEWLMDAVKDASQYQRKLWRESEEIALTEIKKAGVEVHYPDKSLFEEKSNKMIQSLKNENTRLYEVFNQIKNTQ